jgi:hypothetical protein
VTRRARVNPDPRSWTLEVQRAHVVTQLTRSLEQLEEFRQLPIFAVRQTGIAIVAAALEGLRDELRAGWPPAVAAAPDASDNYELLEGGNA